MNHLEKTDLGIEVCYAAPLSYLLGPFSGLAMLFLERRNPYVRFHAMQSVVTFGLLIVLSAAVGWVPLIGWLAGLGLSVVAFVLWLGLMHRSWEDSRTGKRTKVPIAGDLAEDLLKRWPPG